MAPVRKSQRTSHVMRAADTSAQVPITVDQKSKIPVEMEKLELPLNTFSPKKPFKAKIKSVERIVGPKATGETCHIVLETNGEIPFWEGQSYGVIPPVSLSPSTSWPLHFCGLQGKAGTSLSIQTTFAGFR